MNLGKRFLKRILHPGFFRSPPTIISDQIRSDQSLSRVRLFATPWIAARQASLSRTNSRSSLRLTSIESVMPSSHLILCRPLLLPPIPPSIRVFSNVSTLRMRWPKYWSFSFSIIQKCKMLGFQAILACWMELSGFNPLQLFLSVLLFISLFFILTSSFNLISLVWMFSRPSEEKIL